MSDRRRLYGLLAALCVLFAPPTWAVEPPAAADAPAEAPADAPADAAGPVEDPLVAEGRELAERLRATGLRRRELERQAAEATGSLRRILEEQVWSSQLEFQRILRQLGENLVRQKREGRDTEEMRALLAGRMAQAWPGFRERLEQREARVAELRPLRDAAEGEERVGLERELTDEGERILAIYEVLVDVTQAFGAAGVDISDQRAYLAEKLPYWAEYLAAGARVALRERQEVRVRLDVAPSDAELKRRLEAEEERVDRVIDSLSEIATLMDRMDLETATYRQLLFESTGELTTEVFDVEVAIGVLQHWREQIAERLASEGPRWLLQGLVFLLILLASRGLAALTRRIVKRSVSSSRLRISQLLRDTLVSWSSKAVMAIGLLVALSHLGVEIGPLLAGLGIAGFILGFALQDSLGNLAAGGMILAYRPYDVGDVIEAGGVRGKVSGMSLVSTTVLTFDNEMLIVPNSKIWGDVIRNVTAQKIRRIDLEFGVGYGTDVDHADRVFRDILAKHEKVLDQPEPIVEVHKLGDSSVGFAVRPWVRTEDYWPVYWSLTREVKKRLDQEGISIPFPQRDVHLHVATAPRREDRPSGS